MLREKDAVIRRAMIIFDGLIITSSFLLAYILRQKFHVFYKLDLIPSVQVVSRMRGSISDYMVILFFAVPLWCMMLYWNGMYRSMRTKTLLEALWIIIKASFFAIVALGAVVFLFKLQFISRVFFAIFVILNAIFLLLEKTAVFSFMHYARRRGFNYRRIIVVGTGRRAANFVDRINRHPEWGLRTFGLIDDAEGPLGKTVKGVEVIGHLGDIEDILHRASIDEVVFVVPRSRLTYVEGAVHVCETEGIRATIAVDLFDLKIARLQQSELDGIPLLRFETTLAEEWQLFIKRTIDIIVSGLALILLSPLFLIVSALIKLTSPGPVLFAQKRVGLNGRRFLLYKFRTMHEGSHKKLSEFSALNEMKGPIFKIKDDPRITPLGKMLRKTSIDELPQLFNVFMGCMSLVGPRPPLPREVAQYKPWQRRRLSMRPGITCLWQISGRNNINFDEWVKLDLKYLDNWSLWLDFKILIKTIPAALFGVGAY